MDIRDVVRTLTSSLRADFANKEIFDSIRVSLKRPYLRVELDQPSQKGLISVSYLARRITWCPSYLVDLSDAENALFTTKGLKKVNPKHVLSWGFELKAGEEQKLFYIYQVYIRS